jgi:hypothetical protein
MPLRKPASRRFSFPFSSVYVRVAPSSVTVASHSAWPARALRPTWVCFGMLAAKRSTLIFDSGNRAPRVPRPRLHHAFRAAHERGIDVGDRNPVGEHRVRLGAVDAAMQELDVLRLAREHVHEVQAVEIASP